MKTVVPRLRVTTSAELDAVPDDIDHLYVLSEESVDVDAPDGVTVHDPPGDVDDYGTFRDVADDLLYALKSGATVLVCRRDDAAVTVAVVGKLRSRPFHMAFDVVAESHDVSVQPEGPPRENAMEYVHD